MLKKKTIGNLSTTPFVKHKCDLSEEKMRKTDVFSGRELRDHIDEQHFQRYIYDVPE